MLCSLLSEVRALCSKLPVPKDDLMAPVYPHWSWDLLPELLGPQQTGGRYKTCERGKLEWMQCPWWDNHERTPLCPQPHTHHRQGWQLPSWQKKENQGIEMINTSIPEWWIHQACLSPSLPREPLQQQQNRDHRCGPISLAASGDYKGTFSLSPPSPSPPVITSINLTRSSALFTGCCAFSPQFFSTLK